MPYVRTGGVWKAVNALHVRTGGVWKVVNALHVRTGGVWKLVLDVGGGTPPPTGGGPSGPPVSATWSYFNINRIGISVVLGDTSAQTRVYRNNVHVHTLDPGFGNWQSPYTSGLFKVSHYKNGQESTLRSVIGTGTEV